MCANRPSFQIAIPVRTMVRVAGPRSLTADYTVAGRHSGNVRGQLQDRSEIVLQRHTHLETDVNVVYNRN